MLSWLWGGAGALQAAQTLSEATGLHVLAFDWASEHDLGFLPVKYKSLHSGLVTGYMKDTEVPSRFQPSCTRALKLSHAQGASRACYGSFVAKRVVCMP